MLLRTVTSGNGEIAHTLKKVSFLRMFADDDDIIKMISMICRKRRFARGKLIIREGEYGDELYIVLSGKIEIVKKTMQNEKYTVTTLDAVLGGVYVGELALIDNDMRSATVIAKTDCICLAISRKDFIAFGNANPEIGLAITREIARQICVKLRKATSDIITLFSALVEEIAITG